MHFSAFLIARTANALCSIGIPATSDGSRIPRNSCELTKSLSRQEALTVGTHSAYCLWMMTVSSANVTASRLTRLSEEIAPTLAKSVRYRSARLP